MEGSYDQTSLPTVTGDSYTNDITLIGRTRPIQGVDPPDPSALVDVRDDSEATIDSGGVAIDKKIGQDRAISDCSANTYNDVTAPTFRLGDIVCFQLRVDFNEGNNTKSPFVTDFLPAELTYVGCELDRCQPREHRHEHHPVTDVHRQGADLDHGRP